MKKNILRLTVAFSIIIVVALFQISTSDFQKAAPTLYYNGNIITLSDSTPTVEAMLVVDGVIVALGSLSEIESKGIKNLQKVDLNKSTVLPGFIDVHTHFALSMFLEEMHDLSGFKHRTNEDVWKYFEEIAQRAEKGKWLIFKGLDPILIENLEIPSIQYLDRVAPDNPVFIFSQSLHDYWANSKAFEQVNIHSATPDPSSHSYYERDSANNLTGHMVEQEAVKPFVDKMKERVLTAGLLSEASAKVMRNYAKNGNTTIVSAGLTITDSKPLILTEHLSSEKPSFLGNLLSVFGQLPKRQPFPRHFIYIRHDTPDLLPKVKKEPNPFYDIIGVKHWYDGSPYTGSMFIQDPYLATSLTLEGLSIPTNSQGKALIGKEHLKEFIKTHHRNGWQIAIHTQGDAAVTDVINAYQELESELDFSQSRHRLEHCLMLPTSELEKMKRLNLTASFHMNHIYYYGEALYSSILGKERAEKLLPIRSAIDQGIITSLHADQPMFESKPFRLIQSAVERKSRTDRTIGENEAIDLMEAIKALTINAAWQINREDKIGSLEKGKFADFIVLDRNPFDSPIAELEQIEIKSTYIHGNKVPTSVE